MSNQIEHVKTILKELVGRTKDFQNLNAFRLFVLQHNTYDVDKATMLIKRGVRSKLLNQIKFVYKIHILSATCSLKDTPIIHDKLFLSRADINN